jgi:hypothetical protein
LVAGAGALLAGALSEGGVAGVVAGGEGLVLGVTDGDGVRSDVAVVVVVVVLAKSSQAPTASRATTIRTGTRLQLPSSP